MVLSAPRRTGVVRGVPTVPGGAGGIVCTIVSLATYVSSRPSSWRSSSQQTTRPSFFSDRKRGGIFAAANPSLLHPASSPILCFASPYSTSSTPLLLRHPAVGKSSPNFLTASQATRLLSTWDDGGDDVGAFGGSASEYGSTSQRGSKSSEKSVNRVSLIGRVGADPQIHSFEDGKKWASLSLATNENFKDKSGEWRTKTTWHRIVVRNPNVAEICAKYVAKGIRLYVEGSLQTRKYINSNGVPSMITEVVIGSPGHELVMLSQSPKASPGGETGGYYSTPGGAGGIYDRVSSIDGS